MKDEAVDEECIEAIEQAFQDLARASIVTTGLGIKPSIGGSTGEWTKAGRRFFAAGSEKPSRSAREIHILRRDQTRRAPGIFPTNFPTSKMGKKIWAYYIYISYLVV